MTQHTTAETYNAYEHLISIRDKQGNEKQYLPASWRLYELRLRFPTITLESEIVHLDQEHNFVVVKAWIFDGASYAESKQRASAYKQGLLSALDKVETAAKSRAARDYGISTELALDFETEDGDQAGKPTVTLTEVKDAVKTLGLVHNLQQWQAWKKQVLSRDIPDNKLSASHLSKLNAAIEQAKSQAA